MKLAGFFTQDAPESMTRLLAFVVALVAAIVALGALHFAVRHADSAQTAAIIASLATIVQTGWVGTVVALLLRSRAKGAVTTATAMAADAVERFRGRDGEPAEGEA